MDDYQTDEMISWFNGKAQRFDMFYGFLPHAKDDVEKVKKMVVGVEDKMTEDEWGCVCDLMKAGAVYDTAVSKVLEEKNKK